MFIKKFILTYLIGYVVKRFILICLVGYVYSKVYINMFNRSCLLKGLFKQTQSWVHVCGYFWVHVCAFWVHVYGAVGCMYALVGCMYAETLGVHVCGFGCKSMEQLGACLTVGSFA